MGTTADFVNDYVYDPLGRTTRIDQHGVAGGKAVATKRVDFAYDAAGQTESLTRYANLAGTQLVAATDYDFDLAGRLVGMTHFKGGTVFADYDWTFDAGNRMTQFVSSQDGTADYANDSTGQLTGADYNYQGDESYVYDENGNRTNNGYAVGTNNQMTSDGTYRYQYDAEGNRTRRFVDVNANGLLDAGDTDITEYAWDHRDRLVQVTHRAQYAAAADQIIENSYDYANRWTRKILDDNGDGTRDYTRVFAYDGNQIALDFHRNGPCGLQNGHLRERYLWGTAVDQILAEEEVDGGGAEMVTWPLTDHLNTVRDLAKYAPATDTTTVVNHLQYNAFGKLTAQTDAAIESLFRFTARPFDADTDLQNNLHRWYDAETGRWNNEDPISYQGGDSNLYRYVRSSPLMSRDPSGLAGRCGQEIGHILDKFVSNAHTVFMRRLHKDPSMVAMACAGMNSLWGWDFPALLGESKYDFSKEGCGTDECRGTVTVHGQCHWASDVNYFLWGLANHLCSLGTWHDDQGNVTFIGSHWYTEEHAVDYVRYYRLISFWYGDGTTSGRLAWTRAGYHDNTRVPATGAASKCCKCNTKATGGMTGRFGDPFIFGAVIYI